MNSTTNLRVSITIALLIGHYSSHADVAIHATQAPVVDGYANDLVWNQAPWYPIDQPIIGDLPTPEDFSGRYKLSWTSSALYLLAEIQDDVLFDQYANPLVNYWSDDCLEIFIDEDASGGEHTNNFNAFAYHIALDNQNVDIAPDGPDRGKAALFNHHTVSQWKRQPEPPHRVIWEVEIKIFDDSYMYGGSNNPITLNAEKVMGFMLSYCDNDGSEHREHFIGSHPITPVNGDKNRGYIDASVFDRLTLKK